MNCRYLWLLFVTMLLSLQATYAQKQVSMTQNDQTVTLWNSKTEVIFNKSNANLTYIKNSESGNLLKINISMTRN